MSDQSLIAIIPARGGSKGLPNKNLLDLNGHPLIAWSILFALASKRFSRVIVSTDSTSISSIAMFYGAEVPFLRQASLSADDSKSSDVIIDTINRCALLESDVLVLLEPTSPYRDFDDLAKLISVLSLERSKKVMSVSEAVSTSYKFQYLRGNEPQGLLKAINSDEDFAPIRRQEIPSTYYLDGSFYASTVSEFMIDPCFLGHETMSFVSNQLSSFEVDSRFDLELYRAIFAYFGPPSWYGNQPAYPKNLHVQFNT